MSRAPVRWSSYGLLILLIGLPLLGLALGALTPTVDPFSGTVTPWTAVLSEGRLGVLLLRSVALAIAVACLAIPAGTGLAWCNRRWLLPGGHTLGWMTLLPMAVPSYVLAAALKHAAEPGGWLSWAQLPTQGFSLAAISLAVVTAPYVQLTVAAALDQSSAAEEEAARSLGASEWQVFQTVIWPRIRTGVAHGGLIVMLYAISDFGAVATLRVPVLTWRLYEAVQYFELARAAWLGLLTLFATLPLFGLSRWLHGQDTLGAVANPRQVHPRRPSWMAQATAWGVGALIILTGVVIPVVTLSLWVYQGIQRDLDFVDPMTPVLHTAGLAALGATLTVAVAMPIAWTTGRVRHPLLSEATYLTSALPGVLLAFGLLQGTLAVVRLTPASQDLYELIRVSGALLLLGYITRFLAEAYTPLHTAVRQLDGRQLEAAASLQATPTQHLRAVLWPALGPGLRASWALAFIALLKELPVTLLLGGSTGLQTLAFRIWDRYEEALWHDAGLAGLLLMLLAMVSLIPTLQRRHS